MKMRDIIDLIESSGAHDGDAFFNEQSLEDASAQNVKSRDTLIHLSPAQFLAMAEPTNSGQPYPPKMQSVKSVLKQGGNFSDIPQLLFVNMGDGTALVVGHEGRHRAWALQEIGVKSLPVKFCSLEGGDGPAIRWGSQNNRFDKVDPLPEILIGEGENSKNQIPFPWSELYPRP